MESNSSTVSRRDRPYISSRDVNLRPDQHRELFRKGPAACLSLLWNIWIYMSILFKRAPNQHRDVTIDAFSHLFQRQTGRCTLGHATAACTSLTHLRPYHDDVVRTFDTWICLFSDTLCLLSLGGVGEERLNQVAGATIAGCVSHPTAHS